MRTQKRKFIPTPLMCYTIQSVSHLELVFLSEMSSADLYKFFQSLGYEGDSLVYLLQKKFWDFCYVGKNRIFGGFYQDLEMHARYAFRGEPFYLDHFPRP
jgi:hypothetical protein